jgi:hypothetical protein
MSLVKVDPADLIIWIFLPAVGTLIVYGGACAAARTVTGGQPLSQHTRSILRVLAGFLLGVTYLIVIVVGILKLANVYLGLSLMGWSVLFFWFVRGTYLKNRTRSDDNTAP